MDYKSLGLKVGLEVHQQLDTHKLFCNCKSELQDGDAREFVRQLRPTQSEMGEMDRAAIAEAKKDLRFRYQAPPSVCIVEADEEPPHNANEEAIDIALEFAKMVKARVVDEIQFMRKIVIDGSNTAGFQRTALVAMGGIMDMGEMASDGLKEIGITTICLEEDAARKVERKGSEITYRLDRLGIPLIEVATEPEIKTPRQARDVAQRIGSLLRATKKVKRGIGTIREDLNISIAEGARVEIKGVQELNMISNYVDEEVIRQLNLIRAKKELKRRGVKKEDYIESMEVTSIFKGTKSKIISKWLDNGGIVYAIKLKGFSGLLGSQFAIKIEEEKKRGLQKERRVLGPELADYIGTIGIKGIFHSDELPGYGITEKETEKVKGIFKMKDMDAFVLVAERKEKAKEAGEIMINRAKQAFYGVLEETRDPLPDGTSKYSRPLPGKARMYPETDVPPIRVTGERLKRIQDNLPEMLEEKMKRYLDFHSINEVQARQLINMGYDDLFESLLSKHEDKKMQNIVAKVLLNTIPELESHGLDISKIDEEILNSVLNAVKEEKFAKEGIFEVLKYVIKKDKTVEEAISDLGVITIDEDEMDRIIENILMQRLDFVKEKGMNAIGPLMGVVMKELRGKVDGKKVNLALKKKIKDIIG